MASTIPHTTMCIIKSAWLKCAVEVFWWWDLRVCVLIYVFTPFKIEFEKKHRFFPSIQRTYFQTLASQCSLTHTRCRVSSTEYFIERRLCMLMGQQEIRARFSLPVSIANSNRVHNSLYFIVFCFFFFNFSVGFFVFVFHGKYLSAHNALC